MERLQKVIANSGYTSRRKAEELISAGRVKVNGELVTELGYKVSLEDAIMIDDKSLQKSTKKVYYLLNKPRGVISSVSDDVGRKTVVDLIKCNERIYPVGRLDYDTTGLIILTNDGELANKLMHPKNNVVKTYIAKIEGLLFTAEDFNNPLSGLEAAEEAVPIADYIAELMKMARVVKKCDETFFVEEEALVQRSYSALEICRQNLTFQIVIDNDYEDMIYTTISSLMEESGYAVSKYNGVCTIPVKITVEKTESSSGIFLYCGLVVKIADGTGKDFFSYSRTFPKKGGKTERQAYNRAYQVIQEELKNSFIQEFSERLIR